MSQAISLPSVLCFYFMMHHQTKFITILLESVNNFNNVNNFKVLKLSIEMFIIANVFTLILNKVLNHRCRPTLSGIL